MVDLKCLIEVVYDFLGKDDFFWSLVVGEVEGGVEFFDEVGGFDFGLDVGFVYDFVVMWEKWFVDVEVWEFFVFD